MGWDGLPRSPLNNDPSDLVTVGGLDVYKRRAEDMSGIFKFYAQALGQEYIFTVIMRGKVGERLFRILLPYTGEVRESALKSPSCLPSGHLPPGDGRCPAA